MQSCIRTLQKKPPWRSLGFTVDFGVRKLESRWSPKLAQVISDFFMAHDRGSLLYDLNQLLRLGQNGYDDLKEQATCAAWMGQITKKSIVW